MLQNVESIGSKLELALCNALICRLRAEFGDFSGARQSFENALQLSKETGVEIQEIYRQYDLAFICLLEGDRYEMQKALDQLLEGMEKIRETKNYYEITFWLDLIARLYLKLGEPDKAMEYSSEALDMMNLVPGPLKPEVNYFTHAKALFGLHRDDEAKGFLQQAYDRVMLVADNTKDETLRQSWLENVRINRDILETCAERGIGA